MRRSPDIGAEAAKGEILAALPHDLVRRRERNALAEAADEHRVAVADVKRHRFLKTRQALAHGFPSLRRSDFEIGAADGDEGAARREHCEGERDDEDEEERDRLRKKDRKAAAGHFQRLPERLLQQAARG